MFNKNNIVLAVSAAILLSGASLLRAEDAVPVTDLSVAVGTSAATDTGVTDTGTDTDDTDTTASNDDATETPATEDTASNDTGDDDFDKSLGSNGIVSVSRNLERKPDNEGLQNALEHHEINRERHEQRDVDRAEHSTEVEGLDTVERLAKVERIEKVERADKAERPEKAERAEKPERPEKADRD